MADRIGDWSFHPRQSLAVQPPARSLSFLLGRRPFAPPAVAAGAAVSFVSKPGTLLFPMALQDMSPSSVRGRIIAIAIVLNIVVGSLGPAVVGAVSDRLKGQPDGLLLAMTGTAVVALVVSAGLLIPLLGRYEATVAAARRQEARPDPERPAG